MPPSNSSLRLKLRADLARDFPLRAAKLGLRPSTLLGILVWNDSIRPNQALARVDSGRRLARAPLTCSLGRGKRPLASIRAREQNLSLNAYLEALAAELLARPASDAIIYLKP